MKYRLINEVQAKKFYGRYARISLNKELVLPHGGKNRGVKGASNLYFYLDFVGILLDKNNQPFNILDGFKIPELAKDFFQGFDDDTVILPGSDLSTRKHSSGGKDFVITFDPTKMSRVMIKRRRYNHDINQETSDLCQLAEFSRLGEMVEGEPFCVDYFVFGIGVDYNAVWKTDDHFLSDAKYAAAGRRKERQQMLQNYLNATFGETGKLTAVQKTSSTGTQDATKKPLPLGEFRQWHFKDEMSHIVMRVLDPDGRLVVHVATSPYTGRRYMETQVSTVEVWRDVPAEYLVVIYRRISVAEPADFDFAQKPAVITEAMKDRLRILETQFENEVKEIVSKYNLHDRFMQRGEELTWTKKIYEEEVAARLRK